MPSRTWFILAGIWIVGALAWLSWVNYVLVQNAAGIICGYPDAPAREYATCMTLQQPRMSAAMWNQFITHDCLWALLPALGLLMLGAIVRRLRRPRPADV